MKSDAQNYYEFCKSTNFLLIYYLLSALKELSIYCELLPFKSFSGKNGFYTVLIAFNLELLF